MSVLLYGASIVLLIFALIDILTKGADQVRGLPKVAWVFLVILVPVVGSIVWFAVGHDWSENNRNHGRYLEPNRHEDRYPTLDAARGAHGDKRITGTEQELAELEREIAYWARWSSEGRASGPATPAPSEPASEDARLRRAKDAAGESEPTSGS
ncbi:PLD nuclease N-terminal domain-containing protein [Curtobacterium sp. ISL-83]|uniref:PLD nuclease N-terminal domain-containing protein n=1 Tax=Curtobacterium sp. ISL-83 TaxID=2819145 RepID=UPI001BE594DD|nr:PLD nuclease N-terminal domain-containing protein [Curtobacterium sp. ISL-83]MBT2502826.1 PLDc_N domain-containing protein [Curtobacterium sp. ISL-83]